MTQKEIKILGKKRKVCFCMKTMIAYEEMAEKDFNLQDLTSAKSRLALYMAALISADEQTDITTDDILTRLSQKEITQLDTAISECMTAFYHISPTVKEDQPTEKEEENPNH